MKTKVASALLLIGLILSGCQTTTVTPVAQTAPPPPPRPKPILMETGESRPVSFARLIINVPEDKTIGHAYHNGTSFDTYDAPDLAVGSDRFALIARDELTRANYDVLGGENLVFGDDESAKARYSIGGELVDMSLNTYSTSSLFVAMSKPTMKASVTVNWQIYDTFRREVVYTEKTTGRKNYGEIDSNFIYSCYREAMRNLLASESFHARLSKFAEAPEMEGETLIGDSSLISLNLGEPVAVTLPSDFESILPGVVTIKPGAGHGTGFLITSNGYVLTAAHVVSGLDAVMVRLRSGLELEAEVVRYHPQRDVALLKLPGSGFQPLALAKASANLGSDVYTIGNPLDERLSFSIAKGIMSAEREIEDVNFIQTDIAVNPGNSGGPLMNDQGEVLGIISWKVNLPGFEGLSFAVPLREAMQELVLEGGADFPYVPVEIEEPAAEPAALPVEVDETMTPEETEVADEVI